MFFQDRVHNTLFPTLVMQLVKLGKSNLFVLKPYSE